MERGLLSKQEMEGLLLATLSGEGVNTVTDRLLELLDIPATLLCLLDIAKCPIDRRSRSVALIYVKKSIESIWEKLSDDDQAHTRRLLVDVLFALPTSEIQKFAPAIVFVCQQSQDFPELVEFILSFTAADAKRVVCLPLLSHIGQSALPKQFWLEREHAISELCEWGIHSEDPDISLAAFHVASFYAVFVGSIDVLRPYFPFFLQILSSLMESGSDHEFANAWSYLECCSSLFVGSDLASDLNRLVIECLRVCPSWGKRQVILAFVETAMKSGLFSDETKRQLFELICQMCYDLVALLGDQDNSCDYLRLCGDVITAIAKCNAQGLFELLMEKIMSSLRSEDLQEFGRGLILLSFACYDFGPELEVSVDVFTSPLVRAFRSENRILIHAACLVVDAIVQNRKIVMGGFVSTVAPVMLPYCFMEGDLREICFRSFFSALMTTDEPDRTNALFEQVMENAEMKVRTYPLIFLDILAPVVQLCDLNDAMISQVTELLFAIYPEIVGTNDYVTVGSYTQIAFSLTRASDAITPDILSRIFMPLFEYWMASEDRVPEIGVFCALLSFIVMLTEHESFNLLAPYREEIVNRVVPSYHPNGIILLELLCWYWPGYQIPASSIVEKIISVYEGPESKKFIAVFRSLHYIYPRLNNDERKTLFEFLFALGMNREYIRGEVWEAASKILSYVGPPVATGFILVIVRAAVNALKDGDFRLIEDLEGLLLAAIPFKDPLIMQWLQLLIDKIVVDGPAAVFSSALGIFGEAVSMHAVSQEMAFQMLERAYHRLGDVNLPAVEQNMVYFLNCMLDAYPEAFAVIRNEGILDTVTGWFQRDDIPIYVADNIASLLLSVAIRLPELDENMIRICLSHFPPNEVSEASAMANKISALFERMMRGSEALKNDLILAISRLVITPQARLQHLEVSDEQVARFREFLRNYVQQNPACGQSLMELYHDSSDKLAKLQMIFS